MKKRSDKVLEKDPLLKLSNIFPGWYESTQYHLDSFTKSSSSSASKRIDQKYEQSPIQYEQFNVEARVESTKPNDSSPKKEPPIIKSNGFVEHFDDDTGQMYYA